MDGFLLPPKKKKKRKKRKKKRNPWKKDGSLFGLPYKLLRAVAVVGCSLLPKSVNNNSRGMTDETAQVDDQDRESRIPIRSASHAIRPRVRKFLHRPVARERERGNSDGGGGGGDGGGIAPPKKKKKKKEKTKYIQYSIH